MPRSLVQLPLRINLFISESNLSTKARGRQVSWFFLKKISFNGWYIFIVEQSYTAQTAKPMFFGLFFFPPKWMGGPLEW